MNQSFSNITGFFREQFRWNGKRPKPLLIVVMVVGSLIAFALFAVLFAYLIQALWAWLVPDLFPAAVREGTLAASIGWWTALKITIVLIVVGSLFRSNSSHTSRSGEKKTAAPAVVESLPVGPAAPSNAHVFATLVDPLTDRELEVLQLLGKGLTNQQIGLQLNLSESTVIYHIGHIFGKLRVNSRVEAAVWAKEHGII